MTKSVSGGGTRWTVAILVGLFALVLAISAPDADTAKSAPASTVHIRGTAYAFFGIDEHMPGSLVRIEEYPDLSAPVAPDGSYDIEVPDGANVTPYIVPPVGYNTTYLQTFHTSGQDLENVHFQVPKDLHYETFAALLEVPVDDHQKLKECAIVSTFSIHEARDATTFDPGFKNVYPHGLPGSTATISPVDGNTRGPIYFSEAVIPTATQTSSSVDGGVIWVEVPPGYYWLEPDNPTKRLAPFLAHCEDGRLVNASPPWGFYELTDGQEPDPAVMAIPPDETVEATIVGKPHAKHKGTSRIVTLRVKAGERLKAKLSVERGKRRLGSAKARNLKPGRHTLSVVLRRNAAAGPAKAMLTLTDESGNQMVIKKSVRVPKQ